MQFKVPPSLLAKRSAPLNALMTNGMKETNDKAACLPEEDPETFHYFLEWRWVASIVCRSCRTTSGMRTSCRKKAQPGNLTHFNCGECGKDSLFYDGIRIGCWCPTCDVDIGGHGCVYNVPHHIEAIYDIKCETEGCGGKIPTQKGLTGQTKYIPGPRSHYVEGFDKRTCYNVGSYSHVAVKRFIDNAIPQIPVTGNLVAHVQVYILAEKYLVTGLQELALHLLYRELRKYPCPVPLKGKSRNTLRDQVRLQRDQWKQHGRSKKQGQPSQRAYPRLRYHFYRRVAQMQVVLRIVECRWRVAGGSREDAGQASLLRGYPDTSVGRCCGARERSFGRLGIGFEESSTAYIGKYDVRRFKDSAGDRLVRLAVA